MSVLEISVQDLFSLLKNENETVRLIDVRETVERNIACLDSLHVSSQHFTPEKIPYQKDELIVVYCKHGVRSRYCAAALKMTGFSNVYNLKGGIIAWANQIDASMRTY